MQPASSATQTHAAQGSSTSFPSPAAHAPDTSLPFALDATPMQSGQSSRRIAYEAQGSVLGEPHAEPGARKKKTCFNCGSEEHGVGDCPEPIDVQVRGTGAAGARHAHIRAAHSLPLLDSPFPPSHTHPQRIQESKRQWRQEGGGVRGSRYDTRARAWIRI